jgi:N-acetylglucosaminyl-diphospho-decaprenol L-rhamnosyltransferase
MRADVAILIVTYNSERQIDECLRSVFDQRRSVRQQVVIVDNDSTDGTVALVRERFPEVTLVTPGQNLGFAKGVNLAARHADADLLLLLNPDTVVLDHAIDIVVEFARTHPANGLYGGRTLKTDGQLEPSSCWGLPSLWSMALFAIGVTTLAPRNRWLDPESLGGWARDTVQEVGVITGCFLLVERQAWQRLGGLDERYFMYGEDADFSMRAWRMGYRPIICPSARVIHEIGASSATPLHKSLLLHRGKASYVRTHWTGLSRSLGLMFLLLGVWLRASAGYLLRGRNQTWRELWRQRQSWIIGYAP